MTEFTPARLAELRAVAEAATEGPWESEVVLDDEGFAERVSVGAGTWIESGEPDYRSTDLIFETDTYGWDEDDCQQAADNARHVRTFDPPTVLALIAALEAKTADAVVTVEKIADEIAGHPIGSGYYQTTVGIDEAREIAEVVQRLYRGEQDDA